MTFLLIPGAGCDAWYWHLVVAELEAAGDKAIAVDLPYDDESADLHSYVRAAVDAAGDRRDDLVVVGQSLGGFTAPVVAERVGARLIVLVCAMVPRPGETADEWWASTGSSQARHEQAARDGRDISSEFDPVEEFLHDVPDDVIAASWDHVGEQAEAPMLTPWPLGAWPDIPTRVVIGAHDRFFPPDFQRRVARDRLGIEPDVIDSGHCPALARPRELAAQLRAYAA